MPYVALQHSHVTSWAIALLLFFISLLLFKAGKAKGQKITHMILRLFYIFVIVSGVALVAGLDYYSSAVIKGLLAIWFLFVMEMILVKSVKGKLVNQKATYYWIQFFVALAAVFYYGYIVIPS